MAGRPVRPLGKTKLRRGSSLYRLTLEEERCNFSAKKRNRPLDRSSAVRFARVAGRYVPDGLWNTTAGHFFIANCKVFGLFKVHPSLFLPLNADALYGFAVVTASDGFAVQSWLPLDCIRNLKRTEEDGRIIAVSSRTFASSYNPRGS